jgi:hypothetical protein
MSEAFQIDPRKLAAVVYDDGVAIDALLQAFATNVQRRGFRIGGVIQVPRTDTGCGPKAPMELQDVTTGEVLPICHVQQVPVLECSFDPSRLQEARARVRCATDADAALVFVSRFGKEEARGHGFRPELAYAVLAGRPVLTAVRRGMVDNWFAFTDGVGTLLDARLWVLEDWWRELAQARVLAA